MVYQFDAAQFVRRDFTDAIVKALATGNAEGNPWSLTEMKDTGIWVEMTFESSRPLLSAGPENRDYPLVKRVRVRVQAVETEPSYGTD